MVNLVDKPAPKIQYFSEQGIVTYKNQIIIHIQAFKINNHLSKSLTSFSFFSSGNISRKKKIIKNPQHKYRLQKVFCYIIEKNLKLSN